MDLASQHCVPCEAGTAPMTDRQADALMPEVPKWRREEQRLARTIEHKDFRAAMRFVNKVADLAEDQGHHPVLHIDYGKVRIELWTHNIDGLSENDFVLAAKIDRL